MKRLLMVMACLVAFTALAASAATAAATPAVTLAAQPATLVPNDATTFSGVVTTDGVPQAGVTVDIVAFDDAACTNDIWVSRDLTTADDGTYSDDVSYDSEGTLWFQAFAFFADETVASSDCVAVTWKAEVKPVVPANPSSFLCWNHEMTDPVAYLDSVADEMWATGKYFAPQAILGNVVGGTNIGAYHLVCNAPSTLKPTGEGLGGSGEVYSAAVMAQYQHDHASNAADLNVYRIYG